MRTRLLVILLVLKGAVAIGLGVPLAMSDAGPTSGQLFTSRLTDTISFASLAGRPIADRDPSGLTEELAQYDAVYGVAVMVLDRDRNVVTTSRPGVAPLDAAGLDRVEKALVNRRSEPYPLLMPWEEEPIVLAEPVLVDGRVLGAVVTISPTDELRSAELQVWWMVAAVGCSRWGSPRSPRYPSCAGCCARCAGSTRAPVGWPPRCSPGRRRIRSPTGPARRSCAGCPSRSTGWRRPSPTPTRLSAPSSTMRATSCATRSPRSGCGCPISRTTWTPTDRPRTVAALEEAERLSTLLDGLLALARAERTLPLTVSTWTPTSRTGWRPGDRWPSTPGCGWSATGPAG